MTVGELIESWGGSTRTAATGRHVLAVQDTSDVTFRTTAKDRRGLGKIGKGGGYGVVLHAMLAIDRDTGSCLGLVGGRVHTRLNGPVATARWNRDISKKESGRWLDAAKDAERVLGDAASITVIGDRESDMFAFWAQSREPTVHLLIRARDDRAIAGSGTLSTAPEMTQGGWRKVELRAQPGRAKRNAELVVRFGQVMLDRPKQLRDPVAEQVTLRLVEVIEQNAPADVEPIHWQLLTTHDVADADAAWQIVQWYRQRWIIEQIFRTLKTQGLQIEDSQLATADRLIKLVAIATQAACCTMQLVQARDGQSDDPASLAFSDDEIGTLEALIPRLEGRTALQKNPHPKRSLAWAAWAIGKLGGWDGYPKSKPPGPITFQNGLARFRAIAEGWALRDV